MRPRKSFQEKILSNFASTGTDEACQGKLVEENLLVCTGLKDRRPETQIKRPIVDH